MCFLKTLIYFERSKSTIYCIMHKQRKINSIFYLNLASHGNQLTYVMCFIIIAVLLLNVKISRINRLHIVHGLRRSRGLVQCLFDAVNSPLRRHVKPIQLAVVLDLFSPNLVSITSFKVFYLHDTIVYKGVNASSNDVRTLQMLLKIPLVIIIKLTLNENERICDILLSHHK